MAPLLKYLLLATLLGIIGFSCQKDEVPTLVCGVSDPITELPWLQTVIDRQNRHNLDTSAIRQYEYEGQTVFLLTHYPMTLSYGSTQNRQIYNCEGESLSSFWFTQEQYNAFFQKAVFQKEIWRKNKDILPTTRPMCGSSDPINDLPFLKNAVSALERSAFKRVEIYQYEYQGSLYIYSVRAFEGAVTGGSSGIAVLDCNGTNLSDAQTWKHSDFLKESRAVRLLWKKHI